MKRNINKVLRTANTAKVTSILFTSKGEPFLNVSALCSLAASFKDFPLEVQTNGRMLRKTFLKSGDAFTHLLHELHHCGLDTIAFSMDNRNDFYHYENMFRYILRKGFTIRLTVNVNAMLEDMAFKDLLNFCVHLNIHQLTLRKLTWPSELEIANQKEMAWILEHAPANLWARYDEDMVEMIHSEGIFLRPLAVFEDNEKLELYDLRGVAVTASQYCIQESAKGTDEIRSLIFHQDGHLYTSWNSKASRLF
jgi:hypothetical protein